MLLIRGSWHMKMVGGVKDVFWACNGLGLPRMFWKVLQVTFLDHVAVATVTSLWISFSFKCKGTMT